MTTNIPVRRMRALIEEAIDSGKKNDQIAEETGIDITYIESYREVYYGSVEAALVKPQEPHRDIPTV